LAQSKPDPIAHLVSEIPMMPVVVTLVDSPGLLVAEVDVSEEIVSFCHVMGDRLDPWFLGLIGTDGGWVTTVDHPERCVTEHGLVGIGVDVLHPGEPVQPLSRAISGEAAQVHDDGLIGGLHLAVGLGMESRHNV
jgi:hypothetical protein